MSELALGQIKGLSVNSNVVTVPSSHTLYAPGHVIQTISYSVTTAQSTTSTSFVDLNLVATITPKFATSKILITVSLQTQTSGTNSGYSTIFRDGVNLGDANYGMSEVWNASVSTASSAILHKLDSPNTTSAVTYRVKGRSNNTNPVTWMATNASTITVQEIAA